MSTDALIAQYILTRSTIEQTEARHEEELQPLKDQLAALTSELLDACNAEGADSIRTNMGTVSRRVSQRYWTTDWERMYDFIREHDAPYLLEQRLHNGNLKQFLGENPDKMPAGLQSTSKYVIQVRKPTGKP